MVNSGYSPQVQNGDKMYILPMVKNDQQFSTNKRSISPMQIKPAFLFQEYPDTGLDNPAYFDAVKIRKEGRATTKKQKFSSLGTVPDQSNAAKLTKVPGLNIWRLDFSKSDSDTTSRTSWWYRCILTLALVGVLALLISGITVLVHAVKGGLIFGIPWFPFENDDTGQGVKKVAAHFRIVNRHFTPDLANSSSEIHLQLAAELRLSLDIIFMESSLVNHYNTTEDFSFSNGSVVVECIVHFSQPVVEGAQSVGFAFLHALEKGKGILPPGIFYVDIHTVRFAAVSKQIDESVLQDLQGLEPWSEWSSCTVNDVCDGMRMRVRRRKCRESLTRLCGENTEVVETKPCTCPSDVSVSSLMLSRVWSEWSSWSACPEWQRCSTGAIQRRTRKCVGPGNKPLPGFLCSRRTGEAGTQIKHCPCTGS